MALIPIILIPEFIVNTIVHNHFDICPSCGEEYAPTDMYDDIIGEKEDISCELCGAIFTLADGQEWQYNKVVYVNQLTP